MTATGSVEAFASPRARWPRPR
ncbi:hypothetical protein YPPY94_2932, partial [Yersinia pestis PY-94]